MWQEASLRTWTDLAWTHRNFYQGHRTFWPVDVSMPYVISNNVSSPINTSLQVISEVELHFTERWREEPKLSRSQWLVWVLFCLLRVVKQNCTLVKINTILFFEVESIHTVSDKPGWISGFWSSVRIHKPYALLSVFIKEYVCPSP